MRDHRIWSGRALPRRRQPSFLWSTPLMDYVVLEEDRKLGANTGAGREWKARAS